MKVTKGKVITCIKFSVSLCFFNFLFDYFFRPSNISLARNISVAVGVAVGVVFYSTIFDKKAN
ncbi:hypothetical protein K2F40_13005 [Clostridium sp. CM028]|uniref:hypothetical protein n=1 Tax=unclassified Clostridium TaxID=2614128 RepID=UPI001C0ACFF6|nr:MULTISPECIES: hypothetical protein [unclassified Clostridium]MBU3092375.1 hypothetical protein [Clostridium sp. CF011]MBW9146011.1 hypothetical protein [Clostridium sp. CM027]MBW9149877.1 hypothetical protein [Clostridium sp. CM028]UVE39481.1 hypothetical protein KTC92_09465 [Clostridium sp. CM027]WAG68387.1 hypothetical protein LL036_09730 [Clostridium sp. CF011]